MPRAALAGGAVAVTVVVIGLAIAFANDDGEWGCPSVRRAVDVIDAAPTGGSSSRQISLREEAIMLADDGVASRTVLMQAIETRTGSTRYEPSSGKLFVDGELLAQFHAVQLADGTWTVGDITYCSAVPSMDPVPGITPSK